jgi:hypothetical protein
VNKKDLETIGDYVADRDPGDTRPKSPAELWDEGWRPRLNPTQAEARESDATYKLYHAERASGKTTGALHELVEHCFLNRNALAIIIVGVKRMAEEGGAWHKEIVKGQWTGSRYDDGVGLEYTEQCTNTAKDIYLWIENRWGGWSRVLLLSMPVDSLVIKRVKGMEPSFILIDEAQTLDSDTYFSSITQQLGRRPQITTRQKINNIPEDYWENVKESVKGDPVEEARMMRGEWLDRPTGAALFGDEFKHELHVRPTDRSAAAMGRGILPHKNYPINLSYDLGQAHTVISFQQVIPTKDKVWKVLFDEMDYVGQYIPYAELVPLLIKRMRYWDNFMLGDLKIGPFGFKHISDNSAFNQFRARDGSYDAWDIEQISRKYVKENSLPEKYIIKMVECPKGNHSIEARVRLLKDALTLEELLVSAQCVKTIEMLNKIEEDPKERLKPKRDKIQDHRFDAATYGLFYVAGPGMGRFSLRSANIDITPKFYTCGTGRPVT